MKNQTRVIFNVMNVIIWIVFLGLCIRTGAMVFSMVITRALGITEIQGFYYDIGTNLQSLYDFDRGHHFAVYSLHVVFSAFHAFIAYLAVKVFMQLKIDRPFSEGVSSLISRISYAALGAGILSIIAEGYTSWLNKRGVIFTNDWNGSEFLFLAGIIFVLAQVFKRGTELQTENELTV
jgi:hypothetical protein